MSPTYFIYLYTQRSILGSGAPKSAGWTPASHFTPKKSIRLFSFTNERVS